jgi:hypothetical protein
VPLGLLASVEPQVPQVQELLVPLAQLVLLVQAYLVQRELPEQLVLALRAPQVFKVLQALMAPREQLELVLQELLVLTELLVPKVQPEPRVQAYLVQLVPQA